MSNLAVREPAAELPSEFQFIPARDRDTGQRIWLVTYNGRDQWPEGFATRADAVSYAEKVWNLRGEPKTNPLSLSSISTPWKVAGGVALLAAAGALVYKATRPPPPVPGPVYQAGSQTFAVQAPPGTTAAGLQTELAAVLGTTQALSYTQIPLALEDPNAATLWSVVVVLTGATSLSGLNALYSPVGLWFLGTQAPVIQWKPDAFTMTTAKATALTIATSGSPTAADVQAYLAAQGLIGTAVAGAGGVWTVTATPTSSGQLNDLTVSYNGGTQSFAITAAA